MHVGFVSELPQALAVAMFSCFSILTLRVLLITLVLTKRTQHTLLDQKPILQHLCARICMK